VKTILKLKMNQDRWQQVKKIFDAALKLAPDERGKFLDESCDEDKTLRHTKLQVCM